MRFISIYSSDILSAPRKRGERHCQIFKALLFALYSNESARRIKSHALIACSFVTKSRD